MLIPYLKHITKTVYIRYQKSLYTCLSENSLKYALTDEQSVSWRTISVLKNKKNQHHLIVYDVLVYGGINYVVSSERHVY